MGARVAGVLAGTDLPREALRRWVDSADVVLAADAGADRLAQLGLLPHAVIGDMDSSDISEALRAEWAARGVRMVVDEDEATTDCDKLLDFARTQGWNAVTLVSVEGDQFDHMLATLHSAARSPLKVRVALRTGVGWVLNAGDALRVATRPGRRVSLLPLTAIEGAALGGVSWPLQSARLDALGPTSVSNRAEGDDVTAEIREGSALLFVEFPPNEMPFWDEE
jgi:thiamine pyrophosphokinase